MMLFVSNRTIRLRNALTLLCLLVLTACGFALRGVANVPFESIHISGSAGIIGDLQKSLASSGVKIMPNEDGAQVTIEMLNETNDKRILTLTNKGLVKEYELLYTLNYRMRDASSPEWGPEQHVEVRRDFTFDDNQLLAKGYEEARIQSDMRSDVVREVIRRLSATAPRKATADK
jgi:LPS-assembly lipoprotein